MQQCVIACVTGGAILRLSRCMGGESQLILVWRREHTGWGDLRCAIFWAGERLAKWRKSL
jgi:hypothetical protein